MFDLRRTLSKLNIKWTDRGANTSQGHINIKCPYCGWADPSYHLSINESTGEYRCFRKPLNHSGATLLPVLVKASGKDRTEVFKLLAGLRTRRRLVLRPSAEHLALIAGNAKTLAELKTRPLTQGTELQYLAKRLNCDLAEAARIAMTTHLCVSHNGRMAHRVLFPIMTLDGEIIAYNGRSCVDRIEPRYYIVGGVESALYLPQLPNRGVRPVVVLVEGPMDALQAWRAIQSDERLRNTLVAAAKLGSAMTDGRMAMLADMNPYAVIYVPDTDVSSLDKSRGVGLIGQAIAAHKCKLAVLPNGYKDIGEMPLDDVIEFLHQSYNQVL